MPKIMIVDDEPHIRKLMTAYLKPEGYEVLTAENGLDGLKMARAFKPDLIVLDVMLPDLDGMEFLTRLRREMTTYVIMLTARTEETDKIIGLSLGADDYMTKPFSPRELVARIKAALRRMEMSAAAPKETLAFAHIYIDVPARSVQVDGQPVELTALEFNLLKVLAEHRGRVMTREQLLHRVWGEDYFGEMRVVDVHLSNLRRKLKRNGLIETVRGVGYRFADETV